MNTLHISSTNTVREVIEALLKKFLVADNPAKFALYKQCHKEDQGMQIDFSWVVSWLKKNILMLILFFYDLT